MYSNITLQLPLPHFLGSRTFALNSRTYNPLFEKMLDPPLVALYICVSDENLSLFKAKLNKYFCPSVPENKIHSSTHHTHIRFKF